MIELRPSKSNELQLFAAMEVEDDTSDFIFGWDEKKHNAEFQKDAVVYLSILNDNKLAGFFILATEPDNKTVEFRRIVISNDQRGIGQVAILEMEEYCRTELGRSQIWLDVLESNSRGIHIYRKLGYGQFEKAEHNGRSLLFFRKSIAMRFDLLADRNEFLPKVCEWYFDEWGRDEEGTLELLVERISGKYLHSREIPLMILGLEKDELVGVCQLKFREMKRFPEYEHWLGGVYTSKEHRGQGVASKIVSHAISVATEQGVTELYLQTDDLTGGIYKRLGWKPIRTVDDKGHDVLVMVRKVKEKHV